MSFPIWYYTKGIKFYLKVWKNFVWFSFYFFSIKLLFKTLFSPWKRSFLMKDWQGFHPIKATLHYLADAYFRFFGGLVRLVVIIFGLIATGVITLIGLVMLIIWVTMPVMIIYSVLFFFSNPIFASILIAFTLVTLILAILGYRKSTPKTYLKTKLENIKDEKVIQRILNRAQINQEEFKKIDLNSNYREVLTELLRNHDLSLDEFSQIIKWEITRDYIQKTREKFWTKNSLIKTMPVGRYWIFGNTPFLDKVGNDLSKYDSTKYSKLELINYDKEIEKINLSFSKNNRTSILLLGKTGIGKQSIIHYLAKKIRENSCYPAFRYKRMIEIDLSAIIKTAQGGRINPSIVIDNLFHEAASAGNVILIIKNLEQYFDSENNIYQEIPGLLSRYLNYPSFQIIATSNSREYHNKIEKKESFIKNCETIEVKEPDEENVFFMLFQNFEYFEKEKIIISYQTIREIINKSSLMGKTTPLPGRAINFSEEILNYWQNNPNNPISPQTVNEFLSLKTGVPQGVIKEDEKEKLLNLEETLHKRVVGQDHAIEKIANAIKKARTDMKDENRPVGCFLFLGPTGVGKTETAKALAESYYGNEGRMIRFDMNEYQNENSVNNLIGSTQTNTPGLLTSKVKDNPFSLILLDELEKANPKVLDIFLQILDEGYIKDAFDEEISFHGNIIIATSNAGSSIIKNLVEAGEDSETIKQKITDEIIKENIFKVEFLNRFDDVIFYKPFEPEQLEKVVKLMLYNLKERIKEEKNINIEFEEGIEKKIIEQGYRKMFGARSIRRFINDKINNLIVDKILNEKVSKGGSVFIGIEDI